MISLNTVDSRRTHMKARRRRIFPLAVALAILACPVKSEVLEKTKRIGGVTVHYKVVLPNNYEPARVYPGVLGFGGGPQPMNTVDSVIARNVRSEAEKRGYIVVVLAAPNGQLFFEGGERIFPEFLKQILAEYKIQDNRFHIAGPSNGGITAFHVASLNPQYFLSITAFPGYLWEETPAHIQALSGMCINMFVGELDQIRSTRLGWY
jgi:predicted peptidase